MSEDTVVAAVHPMITFSNADVKFANGGTFFTGGYFYDTSSGEKVEGAPVDSGKVVFIHVSSDVRFPSGLVIKEGHFLTGISSHGDATDVEIAHDDGERKVYDLPVLSVSKTAGLVIERGVFICRGGHFYPTGCEAFSQAVDSEPFVFLQSEVDGILRERLVLEAGASVAVAKLLVLPEHGTPFAAVHPMVYTCRPQVRGFEYYLPSGVHYKKGTYEAACDDTSAPAVEVTILKVKPGVMLKDFPLVTTGAEVTGNPVMIDN